MEGRGTISGYTTEGSYFTFNLSVANSSAAKLWALSLSSAHAWLPACPFLYRPDTGMSSCCQTGMSSCCQYRHAQLLPIQAWAVAASPCLEWLCLYSPFPYLPAFPFFLPPLPQHYLSLRGDGLDRCLVKDGAIISHCTLLLAHNLESLHSPPFTGKRASLTKAESSIYLRI